MRKRQSPTDHVTSAASAGLRYVCDDQPGIRREMGALGFRYRDAAGRLIRQASVLTRIRALAVPPAWTDVWICRDPRGHLQATGRDARGRKQYRYHPSWRATRDETKFDRLQAFASALPKIRARTEAHLARSGLPREKVLAVVVQLLEKSLIRVGNDEYARTNRSFGLTTLRDNHVNVRGSAVRFEFRGKSGIRHAVNIDNGRLARIVKQCRDLPGQELFQYIDERGRRQDVNSADVNAYLKRITGQDLTAKDFRTWAGTVLAARALCEIEAAHSAARAKKNMLQAVEAVANMLGNTRSVCRKSYIHPAIFESYMNGSLSRVASRRARGTPRGLRADELMVMAVLQQRVGTKAA